MLLSTPLQLFVLNARVLSICSTLHHFCDVLVANSEHDVSRHALAGIASNQAHISAIAQRLILGQFALDRSFLAVREVCENQEPCRVVPRST